MDYLSFFSFASVQCTCTFMYISHCLYACVLLNNDLKQRAACNICLNVRKFYHGPIRLLTDHDFTVRCTQVESITRGRWMVPLTWTICVPV